MTWRQNEKSYLSRYVLQQMLTVIVVGFAALACILLAEALLQWKYGGTENKAGNAACVLFIFLFIAFFQVCVVDHSTGTVLKRLQCVDAPAVVWAAEVFPTNLRAKGMSMALFSFFVGAITFSTPAPVAFKNM